LKFSEEGQGRRDDSAQSERLLCAVVDQREKARGSGTIRRKVKGYFAPLSISAKS
jgi:hypothetical protein